MAKFCKSKHLIFGLGVFLILGLGFYFNESEEEMSLAEPLQVIQEQGSFGSYSRDSSKEMPVVLSLHSEQTPEVRLNDEDSKSPELGNGFGFSSVEELLDNIDDPRVQQYIQSLPDDAQESIYIASLKQSVSKRLDEMEEMGYEGADTDTLFDDIDTLGRHGLMMPGEVENLKAYIRQRL